MVLAIAIAAIVIVVVGIGWAGDAGAHTEVQRAEPAPAAVVSAPVQRVTLTFLDPVLPGVTIDVVAEDAEASVAGLGAVALGDDGRVATVDFDSLPPGRYVVSYTFVAEDGDEQVDAYRFTVEAPGDGGTSAGGTSAVWLVAAAVSVVVALTLIVAVRRRRS